MLRQPVINTFHFAHLIMNHRNRLFFETCNEPEKGTLKSICNNVGIHEILVYIRRIFLFSSRTSINPNSISRPSSPKLIVSNRTDE